MAPISILELRSVWGTGGGPEKTILLGASLHDPRAFTVTVCYIRDLRDTVFAIGDRARQMGLDYVEAQERHSFDPGVWRTLAALVRDRRIDVVHGHDHKTDLIAYALARRFGVTPLATSHGWSGHSWRERFVYYPLDIKLLTRFPAVIAVSSRIRARLIEKGVAPDRIEVVLNAIDAAAFRRDRSREADLRRQFHLPDGLIIGTVGRLERVKRFDLLLDAFAIVAAAVPSAHLAFAGDGSLRAALEGQASRLGVAGRCHWLGQVSDVVTVHHAFDLFVQSSESEGTPNAVIEAMAMETPIVATDVGGTAELATPGIDALIVPRHDAPALAEAMIAALTDPGAARRRAGAARTHAETSLSFAARTRRLEQIYERVAAPRRRASGARQGAA